MSSVGLHIVELVEQAEAKNAIACAASEARLNGRVAEVRPFSSGFLVSQVPDCASVVGAGPRGKLSSSEIAELRGFFDHVVHLCPSTGATLHQQLRDLQYEECDEMVVMACSPRSLGTTEPSAVQIQPVSGTARGLWAQTVTAGFRGVDSVAEDDATIGRIIAEIPGITCYLARDASGEPLGGGAMIRHGQVAILFGDSTLPKARGRGVQKQLIRRRVSAAKAMNCALATALAGPGTVSQRNYERIGFKAAYTRVALTSVA